MEEFCKKVAEILEIDTVQPTDEFRVVGPYWDSMMGFSLLVMVNDDYDKNLGEADFLACKTVQDLYDKAVG